MQTQPKQDRLISIDALRGVAVLGILMMNIQGYAMVNEAYEYPLAHMDMSGANADVWAFANTFFNMKFITIFSALFGAGIILMVGEGEGTGKHYPRMLWLLLIGLIHAHIFWWGDILVPYALLGMLAVKARKWSPGKLTVWGLSLITLTGIILVGAMASMNLMPDGIDPVDVGMALSPEDLAARVADYQAGFINHIPHNSMMAAIGEVLAPVFFGGRLIGVMFIGMALFKTGFFSAQLKSSTYLITALIGLLIGLTLSNWSTQNALNSGFDLSHAWQEQLANYVGSLLVAMGYSSIVMLVCKSGVFGWIVHIFAATGRMAFTNYLSHTLIMTFIFVGTPGLGLFGTVERVDQFKLVLVVWALQLIWSPLWLSQFRYGPFEWLWRSLTYGKMQKLSKG